MVRLIENSEPNRVSNFFANKTIFVTGGSGFLGKVLIEKLLRSCPHLRKIYVLMRTKKGQKPNERLQAIFDLPLFDLVKKEVGKGVFEKVEVISGDVEAVDLGISPEDRKLLNEEVEIIYHSAATVQFDESFKKSVMINVRGTKFMLELARNCKNLKVFCHLSTAYCQENQEILFEKSYPPPSDPHRIIDMCLWMDDKTLNIIASKIRGSSANTYTFTKALSEGLIIEQMDTLPVIIQRPSAVIPVWKDPLPGWMDNVNGPIGILLGAGKGAIRTMHGRKEYFADYVSVDCVANALICTVYDYITYKTRRIYNLTATDEIKVSFGTLLEVGKEVITKKVAFDWTLWYPGGDITSSRTLHTINFILFQLLPALFIDAILFIFGFKPFLLRVQKRIVRGYQVFEYYANRKWDFRKENMQTVRSLLNTTEKKMFKLDSEGFDLEDYFTVCALGARRFLLNDKDENLPIANRRLKILWFIDRAVKILMMIGVFYYFWKTLLAYF